MLEGVVVQVEELLSTEDVADVLGIPLATLRKWRFEGRGPKGFRIGRHVRFRPSEVQRWIEDQEAKSRK